MYQDFNPDLSSIEFPTDRITLGQMRRLEPGLMTSGREMANQHLINADAICTMAIEQRLAKQAWAQAIGMPGVDRLDEREDDLAHLNEIYTMYGLSSGENQTQEMVRRFETEAARLGRLSVGEGRA